MEEQIEQPQSNLTSHAIRWGLILGVINIIIVLLIYVIDVTLLADWKIAVFLFILNIGLVVYAGIQFRNSGDGFLSFKAAFGHTFLVFAIAGLLGTIFQFLLYNVIDPSAAETIVEASIDNQVAIMESFGMDESQIEQSMEGVEEKTRGQFQLAGLFFAYLVTLVIYLFISLIVGAIVKKNNPEEEI